MPPRITQKSCRPRVSHRIVVGTFSQRLACVASEPNGVEHHCFMKPLSWDKQRGLIWPLESAASQSDETNHPSKNEVGLDVSHHTHVSPEGRGKYFFLDILFHRMSVIGDISTTIRIKCSQLNIFLLRIAGSSTTTTVRDSSKTRKTDNADTHHHLNTGFRPRWRVLRPYPLGSGRRGRHWAGDNIVDSPHRLHAWLVPLIV